MFDVSCSEMTCTFPFLFHGSENNRSRMNFARYIPFACFSPTFIFRISVHSCAIDRHDRTNVPKRSIYHDEFLVCPNFQPKIDKKIE